MKDKKNRRKGHGYWERRELKLGKMMSWKELGKEKSEEIELGKWELEYGGRRIWERGSKYII